MHLIRVAGCALNQTPLDWDGNRNRILAAIAAARDTGASILCLPELCITGYGCEDAFQSPGVQRLALEVLGEIVPATRGIAVAVGLPIRFESGLFDAAAFVVDGRIAGIACKQNLAGDGIHYEPRWFRPWVRGRRGTCRSVTATWRSATSGLPVAGSAWASRSARTPGWPTGQERRSQPGAST